MSWQPIESAPKDRKAILLYYGSLIEHQICFWNDDKWQTLDGFDEFPRGPTHWMPLPEPPKTEEPK